MDEYNAWTYLMDMCGDFPENMGITSERRRIHEEMDGTRALHVVTRHGIGDEFPDEERSINTLLDSKATIALKSKTV